MKPYYQDDYATIYHGDCREIDAWLSADVLVTDPPYGMAYVSNSSKYGHTPPIAGDDTVGLRDDALAAWGDRPALIFGTWRATRPTGTRHLLVWDKGAAPGMGDLSIPWGHSCEEVYVLGDGFCGRRRSNVLRVAGIAAGAADRPEHPTPKPVGLMEQLIECTPVGTSVADPFMGSGTTLRAAKNLGRQCIGIELEERYCEIAAKRLAQEVLDFGGAA